MERLAGDRALTRRQGCAEREKELRSEYGLPEVRVPEVIPQNTRTTRKNRDALVAEVVHVGVPVVVTILEAITDHADKSRLLSTLNLRPISADHERAKL